MATDDAMHALDAMLDSIQQQVAHIGEDVEEWAPTARDARLVRELTSQAVQVVRECIAQVEAENAGLRQAIASIVDAYDRAKVHASTALDLAIERARNGYWLAVHPAPGAQKKEG